MSTWLASLDPASSWQRKNVDHNYLLGVPYFSLHISSSLVRHVEKFIDGDLSVIKCLCTLKLIILKYWQSQWCFYSFKDIFPELQLVGLHWCAEDWVRGSCLQCRCCNHWATDHTTWNEYWTIEWMLPRLITVQSGIEA